MCGLTLAVVGVAVHRLGRYRQQFGLTELRSSTTWISWWLGLLFVMLAVSTVLRLGRGRWMAAVVASAVLWLLAWNVTNTDARIAEANIGRVALVADSTGRDRYDGELTVLLSDDAVPAVVDGFDQIPFDQQAEVRSWICAGRRNAPGGLSWNRAASAAAAARRTFAGSQRSGGWSVELCCRRDHVRGDQIGAR